MQKIKASSVLAIIMVLMFAGLLRLIWLDDVPKGIYVDEASHGYNAYSIAETGKDEYGKTFPIFLRSFGTYASSLYTYSTALIVKIFDLSIFTTRFTSAVSGIILVLITFLIVKQMNLSNSDKLPLVTAIVLSLVPWAIFFSRGAFEANLALMLLILGLLLFNLSLKNILYLPFSLLIFSLSTYAYHAERFIIFVMLFVFLVMYKRYFQQYKKIVLFSLFIFILTQVPLFLVSFTPGANIRLTGQSYISVILDKEYNQDPVIDRLTGYLLVLRKFFSMYAAYFSPSNLFFNNDPDLQRSIPNLSVFYFWMIIPFMLGIKAFLKTNRNLIIRQLLIIALISPIPAALTTDPFSTLRALPLFWVMTIIISFGLYEILNIVKKKLYFYISLIVLITFSLVTFYSNYFVLFANERAVIWGDGFTQLAQEIKQRPTENFVIDQTRIKPAYIEILFFLKYPPELFQKTQDPNLENSYYTNTSFSVVRKFGNIETRSIDLRTDSYKEYILVGDSLTFSENDIKDNNFSLAFEIKDPLGNTIFKGFKTNPREKCAKELKNNLTVNQLCLVN